ncbi:hypothetical protein KV205_01890 [Streptomyces sp. SKN60]|uniref:hypothetical protein n=1 Tax=Streptomyces sp. SKN60 TaxID=2855506 RepID=UPI002247C237|nr:hypothetical protein [Streptomyces sp. SKN60]MCX2179284.1 hypothetical protein [Streptomyces sp. SKN60]
MPKTTAPLRIARNSVPGAARWAVLAAHAVPLLVLPAGLWRLALGFGLPVAESSPYLDAEPGMLAYMVGLTVLSELLAYLTLGLVRPWGEVFLGRRVDARIATGAALVGSAGLFAAVGWSAYAEAAGLATGDGTVLNPAQQALFLGCYLPLAVWPLLLAAVAVAYYRRRTLTDRQGDQ